MKLRPSVKGLAAGTAIGLLSFGAAEAVVNNISQPTEQVEEIPAKTGLSFGLIGGAVVFMASAEGERQKRRQQKMDDLHQAFDECVVVEEAEWIVREARFNMNVERLETAIENTNDILRRIQDGDDA